MVSVPTVTVLNSVVSTVGCCHGGIIGSSSGMSETRDVGVSLVVILLCVLLLVLCGGLPDSNRRPKGAGAHGYQAILLKKV